MKRGSRRFGATVAALGLFAAQTASATQAAPAADPAEKQGSLYLQCDGQPNNMSGGERAARVLGAIALVGLLAPQPESPDASKRKFGAEGVAACTSLIDGDKKETNAKRRAHLILARALHRIEAKDYDAALADAALARREMAESGLSADPYYARSQGRAPDLIEAAALYRMGKPAQAEEAALRGMENVRHNLFGLVMVPGYMLATRTGSEAELRYLGWRSRASAPTLRFEAARLEEFGRFADAARAYDGLIDYNRVNTPKNILSIRLAEAAVAHALAGHADVAAERARDAQANFDQRKADGKPEGDDAAFVEVMDLYGIVHLADSGDVKGARRLFAARSQWVAASFGAVTEVTRRLRTGAAADELIGGLGKDVDQLWADRDAKLRAATLAKDSDNKTLFGLIPAADQAGEYEALSKTIWRTDKSKLLIVPKKPPENGNKFEVLIGYAPLMPSIDGYALHAALLAKARGKQGFIITPIVQNGLIAALFITGDRGAPGLPEGMFNDAETVIADLSPVIPAPETLEARRKAATASGSK